MTKAEVITEVSRKTGIEKEEIKKTMEGFLSVIQDAVIQNQRVHFSGFGSFFRKKRAKKIGRNISANTAIVVNEHHIPSFKPSKFFLARVKSIIPT